MDISIKYLFNKHIQYIKHKIEFILNFYLNRIHIIYFKNCNLDPLRPLAAPEVPLRRVHPPGPERQEDEEQRKRFKSGLPGPDELPDAAEEGLQPPRPVRAPLHRVGHPAQAVAALPALSAALHTQKHKHSAQQSGSKRAGLLQARSADHAGFAVQIGALLGTGPKDAAAV